MPFDELWKWLTAGGGGIGGFWAYHRYIDGKISKKADKASVAEDFNEVREEMKTQRATLAKVFDQIRENEQRAQDRHERLMEKIR